MLCWLLGGGFALASLAQHEALEDSRMQAYRLLADQGLYQEALEGAQSALEDSDSLQESTAFRGMIMGDCALYFNHLNQRERSLDHHLRALALLRESLGPDHPETLVRLNNLALYYDDLGDWAESEILFLEVIDKSEQEGGEGNPDFWVYLDNLANHYRRRGMLEEARPLYLRALQLMDQYGQEEASAYSRILNNLALLYKSLGRYEEALELYQRAREATERSQGKEHASYGVRLNNLAQLYQGMGLYKEALPLLEEALVRAEGTLGKAHKNYAVYLNNLSALYYAIGLYDKALEGYQEALLLTEKAFGKQHYEYAIRLNNLGLAYEKKGEGERALPLYQEALGIQENALGKGHAQYATTLSNVGLLFKGRGEAAQALPYFLESLEITERAMGKEHATYGLRLNNLGAVYESLGEWTLAEQYYWQALYLFEGIFGREHPYIFRTLGNLFPLLEKLGKYDLSEQWLEEVLPEMRNYLRWGFSFLSERELRVVLGEWEEWEEQLLVALWAREESSRGLLPALVYDQLLFKKGFLLQSALSLRNWAFDKEGQREEERALRALRRRMARLQSSQAYDREQWEVWREESFVLEKKLLRGLSEGGQGVRQWSYSELQPFLGPGEVALEFVQGREDKEGVLVLEKEGLPQFVPLSREYPYRLLETLEALGQRGVHTFYAAPIGAGHLQPLTGLLDGEGLPLGQRFSFPTLLSTRQLGERLAREPWEGHKGARAWVRGLEELPFSMQETALVQDLLEQGGWQVEPSLSLKGEGLSLVHLATHGYYEERGEEGMGDPYEALLYMGLDLGDRKINALELSQMNCRGCELVVLSACHSGLGQVVKDEGVYGLQRAFKMAGARYVLVSLRELDDRRTKILMANFYRFWLKEGMEIPQAFRRAQALLFDRFRDPEIWSAWVLIE